MPKGGNQENRNRSAGEKRAVASPAGPIVIHCRRGPAVPGVWYLRSTANTMVRSSTPSGEVATAGIICRPSGRQNRMVKVPSERNLTGSPCKVTRALGSVAP